MISARSRVCCRWQWAHNARASSFQDVGGNLSPHSNRKHSACGERNDLRTALRRTQVAILRSVPRCPEESGAGNECSPAHCVGRVAVHQLVQEEGQARDLWVLLALLPGFAFGSVLAFQALSAQFLITRDVSGATVLSG